MGSVCDNDEGGVVFRKKISMEITGVEEKELHVLAVDDSLVDRMVVDKLLRTSSFRVTVAESGNMALQYLGLLNGDESSSGLKVNLVLTDYSMPGMNGYELMKKIKLFFTFAGINPNVLKGANMTVLTGKPTDENSLAEPKKVVPKTTPFDQPANNLNVELLAFSLTAINLLNGEPIPVSQPQAPNKPVENKPPGGRAVPKYRTRAVQRG